MSGTLINKNVEDGCKQKKCKKIKKFRFDRFPLHFPCKLCNAIVKNEFLSEHMRLCHNNSVESESLAFNASTINAFDKISTINVPCSYCDDIFPSENDLEIHISEIHEILRLIRCCQCGLFGVTTLNNNYIATSALEDKECKCLKCGATCDMPSAIPSRKTNSTNKDEQQQQQKINSSLMKITKDSVHRNFKLLEKTNKMQFEKKCNKKEIKNKLRRIESKAIPLDPNRFKKNVKNGEIRVDRLGHICVRCRMEFTSYDDFILHREAHKKDHTKSKFICKFCHRKFPNGYGLKGHLRIHTGEKPFECDVCSKMFALKTYLKIHQRIHTGEKPYVCDMCNKRFSQRSALQTHFKRKHDDK